MFERLFGKKESFEQSDKKKKLSKKINDLKEEYKSISNQTTNIDEALQRFGLIKQIIALADQISPTTGGSYSGDIICDYDHAVMQITNRLWDILFSKKTNYHNEPMTLQIKAYSLFEWRAENYKRWWSDEQQPFGHDLSRAEIEKLILEINEAHIK